MSVSKITVFSKMSQHSLDLHRALSLHFFQNLLYLANSNELLSLLRQCANLIVYYSWQIFIIDIEYNQYSLNSDITILMNCGIKALIQKLCATVQIIIANIFSTSFQFWSHIFEEQGFYVGKHHCTSAYLLFRSQHLLNVVVYCPIC